MTDRLFVRNWQRWQSYRSDRGQPPWIKVHRTLMRDWGWIDLTDAERGQLVCIWLLAADKDGELPCSPRQIRKLCNLDSEPDINRLIDMGFLEWRHSDAEVTSDRRQDDETEAEEETETETETEVEAVSSSSKDSERDADSTPGAVTATCRTEFQSLVAALADLKFNPMDVHRPKPMALLREWVAMGATPDDLGAVTAMLRARNPGKDFKPAYMDGALRDYLEAKRNGNSAGRQTRKSGAAQRNADLDEHLNAKIRSVT